MTRRFLMRPAVRRALVSLVLGMLSTIAIAWGHALLRRLPAQLHTTLIDLGDASLWIAETRTAGIVLFDWYVETGGFIYDGRWEPSQPVPATVPLWTGFHSRGSQQANDPISVLGAGWPMVALRCSVQTRRYVQHAADFRAWLPEPAGSDVFVVVSGIGYEAPRTRFDAGDPRTEGIILPLAPVWAGFLGDTALFSAAWYLPLLIPSGIRYLRRRRKLCPSCCYSLAGLAPGGACPECGSEPNVR